MVFAVLKLKRIQQSRLHREAGRCLIKACPYLRGSKPRKVISGRMWLAASCSAMTAAVTQLYKMPFYDP